MTTSWLATNSLILDRETWNDGLRNLDGHLLQTWEWGEFKSGYGWTPDRIVVGDASPRAIAQILYRHKGPVSIGYIPRGPAIAKDDLEATQLLLQAIDSNARKHRALYVMMESDRQIAGLTEHVLPGLTEGPNHLQPGRTVKVPLFDDDTLLAGMHQKTRYSVRLAPRKGVTVDRHHGDDKSALVEFYSMLSETSRRNEFGIHTIEYYSDFMRIFKDNAVLFIARLDGHPAAGLIAAAFGNDAIYMYGASDTKYRAVGAAFNLQFHAMQWGREQGAREYDLWGIPEIDPPKDNEHRDHVPATKGDDWRGLYRFKTGFGGSIVSYPPTIQRTYHLRLSRIADRMIGRSQ